MILLISLATFTATLIGGLVAVRLKDKLHIILGFSAGAIVAVAFFDLIPESLNIGSRFFGADTIMSIVALGFLIYLVLDRAIFLHAHAHEECETTGHTFDISKHEHDHEYEPSVIESKKLRRGVFGAGSLSIHSFLDGVAIGLSFQVSTTVGIIVAVAVLVHDFSDGMNTVSMILKNKGTTKHALRWLVVDAIAPVLGVTSTLFFTLPEQYLSVVLALFSGFFLYIGASDLIPESQHKHPKLLTTGMTLFGATVLYVVIRIAGL